VSLCASNLYVQAGNVGDLSDFVSSCRYPLVVPSFFSCPRKREFKMLKSDRIYLKVIIDKTC
jgi:hypothetical protein